MKLSVEECAKTIMEAADRRGRKIFFPFMAYLAVYVRPFFPDYVDKKFKKLAKLWIECLQYQINLIFKNYYWKFLINFILIN